MIKIENKQGKKVSKEKKERVALYRRLAWTGIAATGILCVLVGRLSYLQFIKGKEYSQKAYSQQMKNKIISPRRGTIYDCNGEVLALSVSVDTISLNPGKVCYKNGKEVDNEIIAEGLSKIFSLVCLDKGTLKSFEKLLSLNPIFSRYFPIF